jgi:hypothetical protein
LLQPEDGVRGFAALLLAVAACQTDAPGVDAGLDATPAADATPPADALHLNGFQPNPAGGIELSERNDGAGWAYAYLYDRAPARAPSLVAAEGDCVLYLRPDPGFCDPPCDPSSECDTDDACQPRPQMVNAGPIVVTGLRAPLAFIWNGYPVYYRADPDPTGDLYDPGAEIVAVAPGDGVPGFTLRGRGVAAIGAVEDVVELHDGADAEVTWTAQHDGRIQIALIVGWHGAPWEAMILCETEDDGAVTVPAGLIEQFPYTTGEGLFQWPSWLRRFSRDVVVTPAGPYEMVVASEAALSVAHPSPGP